MSGEAFHWQDFLGRWQREWVPRGDEDMDEGEPVPLGGPGADESAILAAEERLGRRLPPSYRAFLAASDGWRVDQAAGIHRLGGAADIEWTRIRRCGAIPQALDPARLFRAEDAEEAGERRALEALHTELGLSLPRFALTRGTLPTFTTRSWTRAPREGEVFAHLTVGSPRPPA
ncbi:SMI1/KNR4 family protein [Streptomyces hilarionis]|uniref:SMI1/KNR4 family protein n=1 Tax=Streptomyces hilarionis TaxID=2839954 RepID=UPI00279539A1|nr:SMI1/KNR4 family protein [Streptomyces hilarionis]MCQ9129593.1 SMI1/KNR4 family protein [Streptomyces hilarionis]